MPIMAQNTIKPMKPITTIVLKSFIIAPRRSIKEDHGGGSTDHLISNQMDITCPY